MSLALALKQFLPSEGLKEVSGLRSQHVAVSTCSLSCSTQAIAAQVEELNRHLSSSVARERMTFFNWSLRRFGGLSLRAHISIRALGQKEAIQSLLESRNPCVYVVVDSGSS